MKELMDDEAHYTINALFPPPAPLVGAACTEQICLNKSASPRDNARHSATRGDDGRITTVYFFIDNSIAFSLSKDDYGFMLPRNTIIAKVSKS